MESQGWRRLVDIALSDKRDALRALELIAAYAYGRPAQSVEVSSDGGLRIIITERIAAALAVGAGAKVAAVVPGAAVAGELPAGKSVAEIGAETGGG